MLAFDGNGSSRAFFVSFLSSCKDNSDGMKRLDRIVLRLFACKENSDENEVLDRIVPWGHLRVRKNSDENETLIVPGENSDDCLF